MQYHSPPPPPSTPTSHTHMTLRLRWQIFSIVMVRHRSIRRPPFSKIFFSKTAWPVKAKFHMKPQWDGGTKVCSQGLGHLTKMAAMPIYDRKPFKNLLLQNQRASDLVAWYVALGTGAHYRLFKWWPYVDLDLFNSYFRFGPLCFYMGLNC